MNQDGQVLDATQNALKMVKYRMKNVFVPMSLAGKDEYAIFLDVQD